MEIVKIDPDEKYVLILSDASVSQVERILDSLRALEEGGICAICGHEVAVAPARQVVGYKALGDD